MSSIAVIKTGGKQYLVKPGSEVKIEKIKGKKEGDKVKFDQVLLLSSGESVALGRPYLSKTIINGVVEKIARNKKVVTVKFKSKSHYKKRIGHRQPYMSVRINEF